MRKKMAVAAATIALLAGAAAVPAHAADRGQLRPGCSWDKSQYYVQNCKVYSKSMGKDITVQIRASQSSDSAVYLLDGARAQNDYNAWSRDVNAAKVYEHADTTLVMPVGGAGSWYADWDKQSPGQPHKYQYETFLTEELPDYLNKEFGVSKTNNAVVGPSMSAGPALNLAQNHPEQFKAVAAMSGYYQTGSPVGWLGQQLVTGEVVKGSWITDMWGGPNDPRYQRGDASANLGQLQANGTKVIVTSATGLPTNWQTINWQRDWATALPAAGLEFLSFLSTMLLQAKAAQAGYDIEFHTKPTGGHNWSNWGGSLESTRDGLMDALNGKPKAAAAGSTMLAVAKTDPEPKVSEKAEGHAGSAAPSASQTAETQHEETTPAPSAVPESPETATEVPETSESPTPEAVPAETTESTAPLPSA